MKFKYDYLNNTLWRLEGEYTCEIAENNYFRTPEGFCGTDGFHLGEKEWITFTFSHSSLKVHYQNGNIAYQKKLEFANDEEKITWEFTETDRIDSG